MSIFCAIEWAGGRMPGDMLILSAGHAHFSRQGVGIWGICPGFGVWGGHVPCDPGCRASRGTCSVFRCVPGQPKGHAHGFRSSRPARADMPILSGHASFPRDMSIFCATGWAGGQSGTCPFFPRGMLIFRGKEWAYGGYVQASACGEGMSRATRAAWASRGTCPFFLERSGPAGGHAHSFPSAEKPPGRTCPLLTARPGHMGYMSGPWC